MNQKEGFLSSKSDRESTFGPDLDKTYYKLFKTIARIDSLTANQKIILTGIMSYNVKNGEFFMTNETMSYEFGCSLDTIKRTLKELREIGLIKIYKRFDTRSNKFVQRVIKCDNKEVLTKYCDTQSHYSDIESINQPLINEEYEDKEIK